MGKNLADEHREMVISLLPMGDNFVDRIEDLPATDLIMQTSPT